MCHFSEIEWILSQQFRAPVAKDLSHFQLRTEEAAHSNDKDKARKKALNTVDYVNLGDAWWW